jgi:hypothetical protein
VKVAQVKLSWLFRYLLVEMLLLLEAIVECTLDTWWSTYGMEVLGFNVAIQCMVQEMVIGLVVPLLYPEMEVLLQLVVSLTSVTPESTIGRDLSGYSARGLEILGEAWGDHSGCSISLSKDTNTLTIGSRLNDGANGVDSGHVRVFDWVGNAWAQRGADIDGEAAGGQFGRSVSMSANGNIVAAGARNYDANGLELAGHV